jgi:hypothetical protein
MWLRDNFLPRLTFRTLGKITQRFQLPNAPHSNRRCSEAVAPCKFASWKSRLMHRSGHLTLIRTMLSAILVYTVFSHDLPPWLHEAFIKIFKAFLWTGSDVVQGEKFLVALDRVQRSLALGGLGILECSGFGGYGSNVQILKSLGWPCCYMKTTLPVHSSKREQGVLWGMALQPFSGQTHGKKVAAPQTWRRIWPRLCWLVVGTT